MAIKATLLKMNSTGYQDCSQCHSRIRDGEFYLRNRKDFRHTDCPLVAAPVVAAPVVVVALPVPATSRQTVSYASTNGHALSAAGDASFSRWEREYELEG